jgi:hypothetical protein
LVKRDAFNWITKAVEFPTASHKIRPLELVVILKSAVFMFLTPRGFVAYGGENMVETGSLDYQSHPPILNVGVHEKEAKKVQASHAIVPILQGASGYDSSLTKRSDLKALAVFKRYTHLIILVAKGCED